ncbi:MAG TPA: lysylphosphatidylglycerol synthase transmembrane domain-containing protein [Actinomycetota bacterium]|nr:lysylphosphatidylglycerol synthase transmembrane domain-containing protein [Actinomycetota bacterium]
MQPPLEQPRRGVEHLAATLPERPKLVTPGRVIMLVLALVGLYVVWPSLVATFGSVNELKRVAPGWFVVMIAAEIASYACMWLLIGLCLESSRYFVIGTAQVVGNAVSKVVPGGSPMGAAMQYRMLVGSGMDATRIGTGLAAASLINVATLFALPVLALPASLGGVAVDRGLARAAWLGVALFVLLVGGGALLLLLDRPIDVVAHTIERIHNLLLRRRPAMTGLADRLTSERDAVRGALGKRWAQAVLRSAGNVLFDYLALLAALVASGTKPTASLVLLAYVASVVLGMIPITPGGLGFVEAGLAAMLVLAGVPGPSATLATLAYRLVSYWGPILAGPFAYALFQRRAAHWHAAASARETG